MAYFEALLYPVAHVAMALRGLGVGLLNILMDMSC
jgi:hypothetical protein